MPENASRVSVPMSAQTHRAISSYVRDHDRASCNKLLTRMLSDMLYRDDVSEHSVSILASDFCQWQDTLLLINSLYDSFGS